MTLTPRERDIAPLLVQGLSNKQIGDRLGTSIATVRAQLMTMYRRLKVHNRVQAAVLLSKEAK